MLSSGITLELPLLELPGTVVPLPSGIILSAPKEPELGVVGVGVACAEEEEESSLPQQPQKSAAANRHTVSNETIFLTNDHPSFFRRLTVGSEPSFIDCRLGPLLP